MQQLLQTYKTEHCLEQFCDEKPLEGDECMAYDKEGEI